MIDPISIIIGLSILAIAMMVMGFVLSQSLGSLLILGGLILLGFNIVWYFLDKTDTSTQFNKIPKGFICTNCGTKLDPNATFCGSCGYNKFK